MNITLVFLLVCSVSTNQTTTETPMETTAQSCLQDVHAVMRELTAAVAQQKVETQEAKLKELEGRKNEAKKHQLHVHQVAFSASLLAKGENTIGPFQENTPLIYKHIATNSGNAYNPNTGVFTAHRSVRRCFTSYRC